MGIRLRRQFFRIVLKTLNTSTKKEGNEANKGHIHVYKVPNNDGLLEIGFSTNTTEEGLMGMGK